MSTDQNAIQCFVIMAIGSQKVGDHEVSERDLLDKYQHMIKPAIESAYPDISVSRADESINQGNITTDILTSLMYSELVIADVSYPNPNVYYELGVRHACRPGTILIRDEDAPVPPPFDLSQHRYLSYSTKATGTKGVKDLADLLSPVIQEALANPRQPDNHLLRHAQASKYNFPQYGSEIRLRKKEGMRKAISAFLTSQAMLDGAIEQLQQSPEPQIKAFAFMLQMVSRDREAAQEMLEGFMEAGMLDQMFAFN